jgi:hypothetical protein
MALKTNSEMLEEVQNAIVAVMLGQSYSVKGQSVTRANLGDLQRLQDFYKNEVAKETRGSNPQILPTFNHGGGEG